MPEIITIGETMAAMAPQDYGPLRYVKGLSLIHIWIVDAKVGDKTLVDTLSPAVDVLKSAAGAGDGFKETLLRMKEAAAAGRDSTRDMVAKVGRSSRLGERSRGVLDAGATS